jgi:hypothetical protein
VLLIVVEVGAHSPVGLVMRYNLNPSGEIELDRNGNPINEWIINIGGS